MTISFQGRFAGAVASGQKRQTIRPYGKRRFYPGQKLQLYTGMRTKHCRKLADAICTSIRGIVIEDGGVWLACRAVGVCAGGVQEMCRQDAEAQALADGFRSFAEMRAWFQKTHGLPFMGQLIEWEPLSKQEGG